MGGVPLSPECPGVLNLGWWWSRAVLGTFQDGITWRPKHPGGSKLAVNLGVQSCCTQNSRSLPRERQKGCWDKTFQGFIFTLHSSADKGMGVVQPESLDALPIANIKSSQKHLQNVY